MANLAYDVEVIVQEQNPHLLGRQLRDGDFRLKTSVGVGEFCGGFDPSNSCISNLARTRSGCTDMMAGIQRLFGPAMRRPATSPPTPL